MPHLIIHDEAHHVSAPQYAAALTTMEGVRRINLSATLPESKVPHYKYPLLKGIRDVVVRDFNLDLFLCLEKERTLESATALLELIVRKLLTHHTFVKLLIYTREANTVGDDASSVRTFLDAHAAPLRAHGWWIEGIKEDTVDRNTLLREFEREKRPVSILVSCRTLSEGIDLKGANCMLPWDPTASVVDNIQRIGRVLRLYKGAHGERLSEQPPSTVVIPVFLPEADYAACGGDRTAIHTLLEAQIAEGERGNFQPIVNVCTALKSELAEEDAELFNALLNYPRRPKVAVTRGLFECVAKACKKPVATVTEEVAAAVTLSEDESCADAVRESAWDEEQAGEIVAALADTQGITLVVRDGAEVEIFGKGGSVVTVEKKADGGYKSVRGGTKKAAADMEAARKRVAHRMRVNFSDACQILLGLDSIDGADSMGGMILSRLTAEVKVDENWEARRLEWVAVYERLGRAPSQHPRDPEARKAAIWQCRQRIAYRNQLPQMTPDKINILNETSGWKWEEDDKWELMRQNWISIYNKYAGVTVAIAQTSAEKKAVQWQSNQRMAFKTNASHMTPERIAILNDTPGWKWDVKDTWEPSRQHWISQYEKLGHTPATTSKDPDEKKAAVWQSHQRAQFQKKDKCLTTERIAILAATVGWKWEETDTWEPNRIHWLTQYTRLGRTPSHSSKDIDEKRAGRWQSGQRNSYKQNHTWMTPERIAMLEATPGWRWEEEDLWEPCRLHWITQYTSLGKTPSSTSKNLEEKKAGMWQTVQRMSYRHKEACMTPERISALEATPGWKWEEEDSWEPQRKQWLEQFKKLGKPPSTTAKDPIEKKAGKWQSHQRDYYRKKSACMTPERIAALNATPGWSWSAEETPVTPYSAMTEDGAVIEHIVDGIRSRHVPTPPTESKETGGIHTRHRSALEEFHKRFKTMNAATYHAEIATHPADFAAYHDVADQYDARDPPERQPLTKIASLLTRFNKPSYAAIDLGCGRNRLRCLPSVSRMVWTSVDVHAVDATVTVADMGALPFEEETFDIAVLGRSLWARNHMDVLREVCRILKVGGRAIVCESFQRWLSEDKTQNTLLSCLSEAGFDIQCEEGTRATDTTDDVFQYIIAVKK
jgi:hypothetical protein